MLSCSAGADASPLAEVRTGSGQPLPPVLRCITYAAQLLYHHQLAQRYGDIAAAAAAAAAAGEGSGIQQELEGQVEPAVLDALNAGGCLQQQELEHAWALMQEVQVRIYSINYLWNDQYQSLVTYFNYFHYFYYFLLFLIISYYFLLFLIYLFISFYIEVYRI
jgi:hypothetical protein